MLSVEDRQTLLRLARRTLEEYLGTGELPEDRSDSPELLEPRAAFVTLRRREGGELRGCRGEYLARQPLVESVVAMAIASATDDPRFPPVTLDELPELHLEISALTPVRPIRPEEIIIGRHGVLLVRGYYRALLLPQVPVTYGWDRDRFLGELCRKAGLRPDAWQAEDAQLFGFETEVWGEDD